MSKKTDTVVLDTTAGTAVPEKIPSHKKSVITRKGGSTTVEKPKDKEVKDHVG